MNSLGLGHSEIWRSKLNVSIKKFEGTKHGPILQRTPNKIAILRVPGKSRIIARIESRHYWNREHHSPGTRVREARLSDEILSAKRIPTAHVLLGKFLELRLQYH